MTKSPRFHRPNGRLKMALDLAPPHSAEEAIARANANLAAYSGTCIEDVEDSFELLSQRMAQMIAEPNAEHCSELYSASERIIGAAGVVGAYNVVELCHRLCDVLDRQGKSGEFDPAPVAVLVNSMVFLFKARHDGVDTAQLQAGLNKMMDHYQAK